ncbi:MAG: VPLPA-CTERM sorting domain-containing protein [Gammaproteobacteria bacterium]|nr:VPLPA-CTERM sorting domain-containing protein [Gammaproteobacteria bacterium]
MDYSQIKHIVIKSIGLLLMTITIQANASFSIYSVSNITSVIVQEDFNGSRGHLTVTNSSAQPIYAFAVGNNDAFQAFGWSGGLNRLEELIPDELDHRWGASVISRTAWERGNLGPNGNSFGENATDAWTVPDTTTLSWDDLFGSEFTRIVSYWVVGENTPLLDEPGTFSSPISTGSSQSHFFFFSQNAFSPFVAFGDNGSIIAQGQTNVPVPAAFWLFGTAIIALSGVKRQWFK